MLHSMTELRRGLINLKNKQGKQFKKEILAAVWGVVIYHTWRATNWKMFQRKHVQPDEVIAHIKRDIIYRIDLLSGPKKAIRCRGFNHRLEMYSFFLFA